MSLHRPITVRPLENYRLWVEFPGGVAGEADLSDVAGKGVFAAWKDYGRFRQVSMADAAGLKGRNKNSPGQSQFASGALRQPSTRLPSPGRTTECCNREPR